MRRQFRNVFLVLAAAALVSGCGTAQPYLGMGPQEVLEEGMEHFEGEEWDEAISAFERVLFSFPSFEGAPRARYHLAEAYFNKEEYLTAASEFTRFRDRYPTHQLTPRAALGICRSYAELSPIVQRDQTYTAQAHDRCASVAQDFVGTDEGRRAAELRDEMWNKLARKLLVGGEFYFDRKMYDSAIIYFEDVWENYPDTPAAPSAVKYLIEANQAIGYADEAETWRERLLSNYPDSPQAREVRSSRANGG